MKSTSGYALQEGFFHLFKRLTNESAEFPTDVNKVLARFVALDPAKYGRMIDGDASLPQELFDIAIPQSIPEVPADRAEADVSLKVAPLEQGRIAHGRSPVT